MMRGRHPWSFVAGGRRRGWLRPLILSLLAKRPMNGIEIMEEIYNMTGGLWRPSPGSVYPMLAELAEEGLIVRLNDGRYQLSDRGRELAQYLYGAFVGGGDPLEYLEDAISRLESLSLSTPEVLKAYVNRLRDDVSRLELLLKKLEGQQQG